MSTLQTILWSSVGKKFLTGLTGLALFAFVVVHLIGNLTLFIGAEVFNHYAHFLESLLHGWFIYVAEVGLISIFLIHIVAGVAVTLDKWRARPDGYQQSRGAGGASKKTISSSTMIYTGIILLVYTVIHVIMFKYGPARIVEAEQAGGEGVCDLYGLVVYSFKQPVIAFGYVAAMIVLGFHLRHGFWSAFQSLGLGNDRYTPFLVGLGLVLAVLLALGFLILPLYMYFLVDPAAAAIAS